MILNNEIIQKYIDGELSAGESDEIKNMLKHSPEKYKDYLADVALHNRLKNLKEDEISPGFTFNVMSRIAGLNKSRADSFFILSISSVFILLSLLILGVIGYQIISSSGSGNEWGLYDKAIDGVDFILDLLQNVKSSTGLSLLGAVFSFGILITGYFFFEHQKNLGKLK